MTAARNESALPASSTSVAGTQTGGQSTNTGSGAPTQGTTKGDKARSDLRGLDFAQQEQALVPGGPIDGKAAPTPGPDGKVPSPAKKPEAPIGTIESAERQKLLKENAKAINSMEELLSHGTFDWNVSEADARQAINLIERGGSQSARIVMVQELNRRGTKFLERLLDNLTGGVRSANPQAYLTIITLLGRQQDIVDMLLEAPSTYGVNGPTDALAYAMQSLPSDVLTRLARLPDDRHSLPAQWIALTPGAVGEQLGLRWRAAEAAGLETRTAQKARTKNEETVTGEAHERLKADQDFARTVSSIEDLLSYGAFDWAITDAEARKVYRMLSGLDTTAVQHAVFLLDEKQFMDRFLDNLSEKDRWSDKKTFLRILSARKPEQNVRYVKDELLSYGALDWAITDEEARLAFAIVKAMPKDVREQFQKADGGEWWASMEGNQSDDDLSERDHNVYDNQGQAQRLKLSFEEECTKLDATLLGQRIEMLLRMGEVDFVEQTLMAAGLDQDAGHAWIYAKYGFAGNGKPRDAKAFAKWMKNPVLEPDDTSLWDKVAAVADTLGVGVNGALSKQGASGEIDLQAIAEIAGGTIEGFTLDRKGKDDNKAEVHFNLAAGRLALGVPSLSIASINRLADGVQTQTGPVTASGLHFDVKWATAQDPSTWLQISVGAIEASDVWQVGPSDMVTVSKLRLGRLELEAERAIGETPSGPGAAISNLIRELQDTFTRFMGAVKVDSGDPQAVSQQLGASMLGGMPCKVSLASLDMEGYATSDGGAVGKASVKDVEVEVEHAQRGAALRKEADELAKLMAPSAEQKTRLTMLRAEIALLAPLEKRAATLMAKQSNPDTPLQPFEREELTNIRDQLTVMTAKLEVGKVDLEDVDVGGTKVGALSVEGAKGQMSAARPKPGQKAGSAAGYDVTAAFEIAKVSAKDLETKGSNKLEAYKARVAELQGKLDAKRASKEEADLYEKLFAEVHAREAAIVRKDTLALKEKRTPDEETELGTLTRDLAPWVDKTGATKVKAMELQAVKGGADLQTGKVGASVGSAKLEGVEQDGLKVGSVTATGVEADLALGRGLTGDLASAHVEAAGLEIADVTMTGKKPSLGLQQEKDALEQREALGAKPLTEPEQQRLGELSGLIAEAERDEARLAELRQLQKADPGAITPALAAELAALQASSDVTYKKVALVKAAGVSAGMDAHTGKLSFGVAGKDGAAGLEVSGIEMGREVDGQRVADQKVAKVKAEAINGALQSKDGAMPDMLAMSQGKQDYAVGVAGEGIAIEGYEAGKKGEAGYKKLDSGTIESLEAGYDSQAGQLDVSLVDAELQGLVMQGGSKIEGLHATQQRLAQIPDDKRTPRQQELLKKAEDEIAKYAALEAQVAKARSPAKKRQLAAKLGAWTKSSQTSIDKLTATDLELGVSGVGNVLAPDFDTDGRIDVTARSKGELAVEGVKAGDTKLKKGRVKNLDAKVTDALGDEKQRGVDASMDEVEASNFKSGGTYAGHARGKQVTVGMHGGDTSFSAQHLGLSGAGANGASVGYAGLSNVEGKVGHGSVSASFAGATIERGRYKSKELDAKLGSLKAKKGSFAMGPGGKVSGKLASFSGDDISVERKGADGKVATRYGVGSVEGGGAEFSKDAKTGMKAELDGLTAQNLTASGEDLGGRTVEVGNVTVNRVKAELGPNGDFKADVKEIAVGNARWDDGKGRQSNVDALTMRDLNAEGNADAKTVKTAGLGTLEVKGVHVDEANLQVDLDLATVGDIQVQDAELGADGKLPSGQLHVGSGRVEDLRAAMTDANTGAKNELSVREAGFDGVNALSDGQNVNAGVDAIHARDVKGSLDTSKQSGQGPRDRRDVSLDALDLGGVGFAMDTKTGDFGGGVDRIDAKNARTSEVAADGTVRSSSGFDAAAIRELDVGGNLRDDKYMARLERARLDGASHHEATEGGGFRQGRVGSIDLKDARVAADLKDQRYGGRVGSLDVADVDYQEANGDDSKTTRASLGQLRVRELVGEADTRNGVYTGGFDQIAGADVAYDGYDAGKHTTRTGLGQLDNTERTTRGQLASFDLRGGSMHADTKDDTYGGKLASADVRGGAFEQSDFAGNVVNRGSIGQLSGQGLGVEADLTPGKESYAGGFKQIEARDTHVQLGSDGAPSLKLDSERMVAGDGKDYSSIVMDPTGRLNGDLKAIDLGPETRAAMNGKGGPTQIAAEHTRIGEVRLRDFAPGDLTAERSSLQVFDLASEHFLYNSQDGAVIGDGVALEAAFVKGMGKQTSLGPDGKPVEAGRVMAGYAGAHVDSLEAYGFGDPQTDDATTHRRVAHVKDLDSSGGHVVMDEVDKTVGGVKGKSFEMVYGKVKDLSAGTIKVDVRIPPPSYEKDYAAWQEKVAHWHERPAYDPAKDRTDLSGLGQMDAIGTATYHYNEDVDGAWDDVGAFFYGRSASVTGTVIDGNVGPMAAGPDQLSVGGVVAAPVIGGVNGIANELIGVGNLTGHADIGKMGGAQDVADYYKPPEAPESLDYVLDRSKESTLDDLELHAHARHLGGGRLQLGRDFEADMEKGGSADVDARRVGEHINAELRDIGFNNVEALDGQVKAGHVGTKKIVADVYDAGDPLKTRVVVEVEDGKVSDVQYGKAPGKEAAGFEAEADAMTRR